MSFWGNLRQGAGSAVDLWGTAINLPEWGISERLAGGPTIGTARAAGNPNVGRNDPVTLENPNSPTGIGRLGRNPWMLTGTGAGASAPNYGAASTKAANQELANAQRMWEQAYAKGLLTFDEMQAGINADRITLASQLKAVQRSYDQQVKGLGLQREGTLSGIQSYFGAISPEAYQSNQGVRQGEAQTTYQEGMSDAANQLSAQRAAHAAALSSLNKRQKSVDAYKAAMDTFRTQGGVEPTAPSIKPLNPKLQNVDIAKHFEKLSNMDLSNQLAGMTPAVRRQNIMNQMKQENLDPDLQDFLYQQLFPEEFVDYSNTFPTQSDYARELGLEGY